MALIITPVQEPLKEFRWDQFAYNVQPLDLHDQLWNLLSHISYMNGDVWGNTNGVLQGLTISAGSGMAFNIASGRGRAYNGLKLVQLTTPSGIGQPAAFNTGTQVVNGTGMSAGQTRIDSICLQITQTAYTDGNGADRIVDSTNIVVVPGSAATPGTAPVIPGTDYLLLADVTVHYGDTASSQATISYGRVNYFSNIQALSTTVAALNAVLLSPVARQTGNIQINGWASLGSYLEIPQIVTPSAPAAGYYRMYYKSDGNRYVYDPTYGEQLDIPVGVPTPWPVNALPSGCIWWDGSAISRTTYARLFGLYGTSYGAGNGVTTFNVGDGRGRHLVGPDNYGQGAAGVLTTNNTQGNTGGSATHLNTVAEMVAHSHTDSGHNHTANDPGHTHVQNAHTHVDSGHTHTQNPHTHTDAGHGHGVTDPGHFHGPKDPSGSGTPNFIVFGNTISLTGGANSLEYSNSTTTSTTGISINTGFASINNATVTENAATANISSTTATNQTATTGITNNSSTASLSTTGGGASYNIMNPYTVIGGWIVRY